MEEGSEKSGESFFCTPQLFSEHLAPLDIRGTLGAKPCSLLSSVEMAALVSLCLRQNKKSLCLWPLPGLRTVRWMEIWSWEAGWEVMTVGSVIIVITALSSRQQEVTHRLHSEACQDLPPRIPSFQGLVIPRSLAA